jgi:4-oxalocrotonate tautomerase
MPILTLTLSGRPDASRAARTATRLSALTQQHLGKDPAVTAVAVTFLPPEQWFVGGPSLAEAGRASFWLDIKVVDGSNTRQELEAYQAAVFAAMAELAEAPLHQESYILVHEVPAAAYGFGGLSQERRFIAGRLGVAA